MRRPKLCTICVALLLAGFCGLIILRISKSNNVTMDHDNATFISFIQKEPIELRVVHLDLKGAPPKLSYLKAVLPLMSAAGANTLLVEYEDTFPYEGMIRNLSNRNAYTALEIEELLSYCEHLNMEVIPLIQTFGHLEFVLKLPEFKHLRENPLNPQDICPSKMNSFTVIREMLQQVMHLHKKSRYLHIGCDEVSSFNFCSECLSRKQDAREIFIDHVGTVASFVKSTFEVTPLIWDDMLRNMPPLTLKKSGLDSMVEPVIWAYGENIATLVPHRVWYWYLQTFERIWVAGAFKGATSETAILPDMRLHYANQMAWLRFIAEYIKSSNKITGYVLTGWSRYDHFATLCEILPVGVPSLILNLLLISSASAATEHDIVARYDEILRCNLVSLDDIRDMEQTRYCSFPGEELISLTIRWSRIRDEVDYLYTQLLEKNAWLTSYHYAHNKTNPEKVIKRYRRYNFVGISKRVDEFASRMKSAMLKYFTDNVAQEWMQEHVAFYTDKMKKLKITAKKMVPKESWNLLLH